MMKLNLDALEVESFDTAPAEDGRGTVHAAGAAEMSYYPPTECPPLTCDGAFTCAIDTCHGGCSPNCDTAAYPDCG